MKLGICVGHSRDLDKGAVSVEGVSEWGYNRVVAEELHLLLTAKGVESLVVEDYHSRSYTEAMNNVAGYLRQYGATHAIELHFNSGPRMARGAEWLHWHSSTGGQKLALALRAAFITRYPEVPDRGIRARTSGDRGSTFLRKTHCPAVICEPFFGSNPADWSLFAQAGAGLAKAYANAIISLTES